MRASYPSSVRSQYSAARNLHLSPSSQFSRCWCRDDVAMCTKFHNDIDSEKEDSNGDEDEDGDDEEEDKIRRLWP